MRGIISAAFWFAIGAISLVAISWVTGTYSSFLRGFLSDFAKNETDAGLGVEFLSNLGPSEFRVNEKTVVQRFAGPIIFNSHVVYSPYFAEQYGFPSHHVYPTLPPYLDYFSVDVKSAGRFSSCHIKMLLDKDGPVPLPKENIFQAYSGGNLNMIRAALPKRLAGAREKLYQQQFRMNQSELDSRLGLADTILSSFAIIGMQDETAPSNNHVSYTVAIETLKNDLFSEWIYVELATQCSPMFRRVFAQPKVFLLGNPKANKRSFLPGPRTFDASVKLPVPVVVRDAVAHDLEKIKSE